MSDAEMNRNKTPRKERSMFIEGRKIEFFKDLFEKARAKRDECENFERNQSQYAGTETEINGKKLEMTRNITYELIESQVSTQIPSAKVIAERWSERNERNAIRVERFLNGMRNKLPFEEMNDKDERSTYIYGASVWLVDWDDSIRTATEQGGVVVTQHNIMDFVPQPGLFRMEDMDYCFLIYTTTKEDVVRKYSVTKKQAEDTEKLSDRLGDDDTVDVIICWYRDENDNVCQYTYSGDVELADITDYYSRKIKKCRLCGRKEGVCACPHPDLESVNLEYEELERDITLTDGNMIPAKLPVYKNGVPQMKKTEAPAMNPDGTPVMTELQGVSVPMMQATEVPVMKKTRLPWYKPKSFPVIIRKNVSKENALFGQSDCESIRPQQLEVNKLYSRMHEKIMMASRFPFKPEDSNFKWDNSIGGHVLNLKPNEAPGQFGVIDTTYNPQPELLAIQDQYEAAKRILGITSSYQGQTDTSAKSGVAKQVQVAQSAGRLESKRAMKNAAYADIDRAVFELYLAFADEPRPVAYKDELGRTHNETFNRYDFLEFDEETGKYSYNDRFLFAAEPTTAIENQREMMWQINQSNLAAGTYGDPANPMTMLRYWQQQEKAHYPDAVQNVEYFQMLVTQQQTQADKLGSFSAAMPAQAQQGGGMALPPRGSEGEQAIQNAKA